MRRRWLGLLMTSLVALAPLAACGDDDTTTEPTDAATSGDEGAFPVSIDNEGGEVTIAARPERIVSLSATATEMLFAIGAGDQVTAVDEFSDYPPEAPTTDLSGFEPNVEAIASHDPDLVLAQFDPGGVVDGLSALDIPTLVLPAAATLDDAYTQFEQLGVATGHVGDAAEVVAAMQSEIEEVADSAPELDEPLTFYHELDNTLFTATSASFIGELYATAGLDNIADEAPGESDGYVQLSPEYVIGANPDLIFLADAQCCGESATTVAARPGWGGLTAVSAEAIVELDEDIASRWGPRAVDFLQTVVDAVEKVVSSRPIPAGSGN